MIDLHSHLLPGIDDGPRTIEDTVELARQSLDQGVTHMICTPHIHIGVFDNNRESIKDVFDSTVNTLRESEISIRLSYSCEVRIGVEITDWILQSKIPLLGFWEGKAALLLELPHSHIPAGADSLIKWLLKNNIQPIIPHPERNRDILENYDRATWLKSLGVLFQATAGSFTGTFGSNVESLVWRMLNDNLFAYVASDMHNLSKRPNEMSKAYKAVLNQNGESMAKNLFVNTPKKITLQTIWQ
ncbi:tyrosine-protein phosphatase [Glaciecola sp. SC05]|uniref:tyrosine-protein phosphatase n=1 Tax=Glaciecola sp. SC05 TaxID=1987355 RepID=UPI0035285E65